MHPGENIKMNRATFWLSIVAFSACAVPAFAENAGPTAWTFAGNDVRNTRNADGETKITPANAAQLQPHWSTVVKGGARLATPTSDGESLFIGSNAGILYRIDRKTGQVLWQTELPTALGIPGASSKASVAVGADAVVIGLQNTPVVAAFERKTGRLLWKTTVEDHPGAIVTQSAIIVGGKVFIGVSGLKEEIAAGNPNYKCCSFRGSQLALDIKTGKILWKTYTVPEGYSGGSIWSSTPAYDPKRNLLFITTGNNFSLPPEVVKCADNNKDNPEALAACTPEGVWFDSILALDADTGALKWGRRFEAYDVYTQACLLSKEEGGTPENCQGGGYKGKGDYDFGHAFSGDYDFGNGAMLWEIDGPKGRQEVVGAGQKSGDVWALDRDTGKILWKQNVGPGGPGGGMEMGSAVDGKRIYVGQSNAKQPGHKILPYKLPSGEEIKHGSYAALDAATGKILWWVPAPNGVRFPATDNLCTSQGDRADCMGAFARGPVSAANGVMYACSTEPEGHMYAFDAATGKTLWTYPSGARCESGAAIIDGTVYWVGGQQLHAFAVGPKPGGNNIAAASAPKMNRSVWDGLFTTAQADAGKRIYAASCATSCHLENMNGSGPSPALIGDFIARWDGQSLGMLYQKIVTTMPQAAPGSLKARDYLAVTAYLLSANGFPAGKQPIKADETQLNDTQIRQKK